MPMCLAMLIGLLLFGGYRPASFQAGTRSRGRLSFENLVTFAESDPGCLLRVQICRAGRSHDVSSNVPARTRITPSCGLAVNPTRAIRAHEANIEPPAVGRALERTRLACSETEAG